MNLGLTLMRWMMAFLLKLLIRKLSRILEQDEDKWHKTISRKPMKGMTVMMSMKNYLKTQVEGNNQGEPEPTCSKAREGKATGKTKLNRQRELIKSPSDSTVYAPTLRRVAEGEEIIDKISNSVESICMSGNYKEKDRDTAELETARKRT